MSKPATNHNEAGQRGNRTPFPLYFEADKMCLKASKKPHPNSIKSKEEGLYSPPQSLMKRKQKQRTAPRSALPIHPRTSISVCRVYSISPREAFLTHPRTLKKCIRIVAKISVCSLWMYIRSLWMAIRRLQTEISISGGENCCMLRGGLQHAV